MARESGPRLLVSWPVNLSWLRLLLHPIGGADQTFEKEEKRAGSVSLHVFKGALQHVFHVDTCMNLCRVS